MKQSYQEFGLSVAYPVQMHPASLNNFLIRLAFTQLEVIRMINWLNRFISLKFSVWILW
jgi:hypothetical protein